MRVSIFSTVVIACALLQAQAAVLPDVKGQLVACSSANSVLLSQMSSGPLYDVVEKEYSRSITLAKRWGATEQEIEASVSELTRSFDSEETTWGEIIDFAQSCSQGMEQFDDSSAAYEPETVLVLATPGYLWASEDIASVLDANALAVDMPLNEAYEILENDDNVIGLVELRLNLDQFYESVTATCMNKDRKKVWKKKRILNFGGGQDRLARDMVGGLLKKVRGKECP